MSCVDVLWVDNVLSKCPSGSSMKQPPGWHGSVPCLTKRRHVLSYAFMQLHKFTTEFIKFLHDNVPLIFKELLSSYIGELINVKSNNAGDGRTFCSIFIASYIVGPRLFCPFYFVPALGL